RAGRWPWPRAGLRAGPRAGLRAGPRAGLRDRPAFRHEPEAGDRTPPRGGACELAEARRMKRLIALLPLLCTELSAAAPVAIESDCEQSKLRRINDRMDGTHSDQQLERVRPGPVSVFASIPSTDAQVAA